MNVYLDNAATTPLDKEVLQEMLKVMETNFGNPSSIHAHGREARTILEKSRRKVAELLKTSPSEIFFTSGGTEADNMAIRCAVYDLNLKHAITSRIEHHAVLHTLQALEKNGLLKLSYVAIDDKGNIDLHHLESLLRDHPSSLVSIMHANNEIGTLNPIEEIGDLCESYNAIFHCDTVQTIGHYKHDLSKLKVHFMVGAAHKLHGPKGAGFIHINHRIKINPLLYGGSQERNMRGGTENLYGIVGLAKALDMAYQQMDEHQQYIQGLKSYMIAELLKLSPEIKFNGETEPSKSLYTILSVSFPSMEMAEMLLFSFDIAGISVSGGSACSSGTNIGSHVLEGIGADPDRPAVRFSFSKLNTREEIDYTIAKIKEICFPEK
jgi:cysteine desulfurase